MGLGQNYQIKVDTMVLSFLAFLPHLLLHHVWLLFRSRCSVTLTMPIFSALTIFTAIALGLSSPYLLFSVFPKLISRLPKPGAWMETLKEAMAFPIYATVAWLLWTLNSLI